ncbi:MAG: hypothetical protein ChlgKO_02700 [Chlamydiales bacterium]
MVNLVNLASYASSFSKSSYTSLGLSVASTALAVKAYSQEKNWSMIGYSTCAVASILNLKRKSHLISAASVLGVISLILIEFYRSQKNSNPEGKNLYDNSEWITPTKTFEKIKFTGKKETKISYKKDVSPNNLALNPQRKCVITSVSIGENRNLVLPPSFRSDEADGNFNSLIFYCGLSALFEYYNQLSTYLFNNNDIRTKMILTPKISISEDSCFLHSSNDVHFFCYTLPENTSNDQSQDSHEDYKNLLSSYIYTQLAKLNESNISHIIISDSSNQFITPKEMRALYEETLAKFFPGVFDEVIFCKAS